MADANVLYSAKVIKAKFKIEDTVRCDHLYCTVLYCTVLYCTVLHCTVLYCTVLYSTVLYSTVLYCTVLYCSEDIDCNNFPPAKCFITLVLIKYIRQ